MRTFLKYFFTTFLIFTLIFTGSFAIVDKVAPGIVLTPQDDFKKVPVDPDSPLYDTFSQSKRINILLIGLEEIRSDVIMIASYDVENGKVDLISVPRDTYYDRSGHTDPAFKKINSIYQDEGVKGVAQAVSEIMLGLPIHYYLSIDYDGVGQVVDSLDGVEVNVPINMNYDDPYDKPPLHIHLKKGVQVLDGKKAIQFLRFRKNNNGTGYAEGDIERVKAQQEFMKSAFKKSLSIRLPVVAATVIKNVKTDMSLKDATKMATKAMGMTSDSIQTYSLPGEAHPYKRLSFYFVDTEKTAELLKHIYTSGTDGSSDTATQGQQ